MAEPGQGNAPSVRLPLVSDSIAPATQEVDEEDLFGSEGEEDVPASAPAPSAQRSAAAATGKATRDEDQFDEKDLFGDENDVDEKDLFGSDGEDNENEIDEKELFGSDEEARDEAKPGEAAAEAAAQSEAEPSEFDEREIFGDLSDDEVEEKDVDIRRRPAPSDDRTFKSLRLPNILTVEKTPFDATNIAQSLLEGYKEFMSTQDKQVVKLLNPENCIRWRFKKGADGQNLMDEDGRPQYESNARIVEWEDGSKHFYIGAEVFSLSEIEDTAIIFEENSQDIHVCHGRMAGRLVVTPIGLSSVSHAELKKTQFRKANPVRRSLLLTPESETTEHQFYELEMEQRKKQEKQALKRTAEGGQEITAAFLEEDQAGPSVLDIKREFKAARM